MGVRSSLCGLAALIALNGCQPGDNIQMMPGIPSNELRACAATGGFIAQRGRRGQAMCVHPYGDAGQACRSGSDCQGKCIASGGGDTGLPQAGHATAGFCQADDKLFGCYAQVENGVARAAICVD